MSRTSITGVLVSLAFATATAHAFIITPQFDDITHWTPDQIAVIDQAAADWSSRLGFAGGNNQNIYIQFQLTNAGTADGAYLGQWNFSRPPGPRPFPYSNGMTHSININADYFPQEYFSLADPVPGSGYDMLTVIRHELGHALGFTNNTYFLGGVDEWGSRITGNFFDPLGLGIPMNSDHSHIDNPSDLMYFSLNKDTRKNISDNDVAMLALAYGYTVLQTPEPASLGILSLAITGLLLRRCRN